LEVKEDDPFEMVNNKMSAKRWRSIKETLLRHIEIQKNLKVEEKKAA